MEKGSAHRLAGGLLGVGSSADPVERRIVVAEVVEGRFGAVGRLGGWMRAVADRIGFLRLEEEHTVAGIDLEWDTAASLAEEDSIHPEAAGFLDCNQT